METKTLNWADVMADVSALADQLPDGKYDGIYCVPKNGMILGWLLSSALHKRRKFLNDTGFKLDEAAVTKDTLIFDDLVDSGKTLARFKKNDTAVLYRKPYSPETTYAVREVEGWITFPFESPTPAADNVTRLLELIGEDPNRQGLQKTPERFVKMFLEMTKGYYESARSLFESKFESNNSQMVVVKDIDFYSLCEHHLVPFFGKAHVAYIPSGHVLGLSKFARLVEVFARRLQIQEELTEQICTAIQTHLKPAGVMVVIEAQHLCMSMRGVQKMNAKTITSALRGAFKEDKVKTEAFKLIY